MTAAQMAEHVVLLTRQHQLGVGTHSRHGRACRKERQVRFRPVKSAVTYAFALHEIGHVVGSDGPTRLEQEALAWKWAMDNAKEWTDRMTCTMVHSLESYLRWGWGSRQAVVPGPGSLFYKLLKGEVLR